MKVYVDKVSKRLYSSFSLAEGAITLSALVGVIALSVLAVLSFRPRTTDNSLDNSISVSDSLDAGLTFQNTLNNPTVTTEYSETGTSFSYKLIPANIQEGISEYELMTIGNSSQLIKSVQFDTVVNGYAQDSITLTIIKDGERYQIFRGGISTAELIDFESGVNSDIELEIVSSEKINFPVEISIFGKYSSI